MHPVNNIFDLSSTPVCPKCFLLPSPLHVFLSSKIIWKLQRCTSQGYTLSFLLINTAIPVNVFFP
jgi:hypothetical protein